MIDIPDIVKEAINSLGGLLTRNHRELVNHMRTPTPQKVSTLVQVNASGNISNNPSQNYVADGTTGITIYQCPINHEAWIHRIAISTAGGYPGGAVPIYSPKSPLTAGEIVCYGGSQEMLFFLPIGGVVAPIIITEGFASAIHLNGGASMKVVGDGLTANISLRFDMQIMLVTGISEYTPIDRMSQIPIIVE